MNPLLYFKVSRLLRQSRFVEACAFDIDRKYINLTWTYYKLGMYEAALAASSDPLDFYTLFAKTISASYIGEHGLSLSFLNSIKESYPKYANQLIQPLATYSPQYAFELAQSINETSSPIYILLHALFEGKEKTILNYSSLLSNYSIHQPEYKLLRSNILLDSAQEKLDQFNDYLQLFRLQPIDIYEVGRGFQVRNLVSKRMGRHEYNGPLVSILIPAFNVETRIINSVKSLINQTYSNIEILIVDDASTDDTANIIRKLEREYSQVKGVYLPINVGPFLAKNYAAVHARGEFVTTQDADDWAHPERIFRQIQPLLKDSKLVASTCQWIRLDDFGSFYAKQHFPFSRFNPSSPMFRRDIVVNKTGLWDCVRMAADTEFIERLKLVFGRKKIFAVKQPLVIGAHRENSLMTSMLTGNSSNKMSSIRLSYWESWRNWHINLTRNGMDPKIPNINVYKPSFQVPELMEIPRSSFQLLSIHYKHSLNSML